ncbi:hypothetical protein KAU33_07035 [Candidatus Dependentiae bacterium]|nr:hypothetical protein [Candidatus Dependentiae bacterium]
MKMSRLKFSGILILIIIFCLLIFARSQIKSHKFVKEEKEAAVYLYILEHGNYEWTFLTTGLWPGDSMEPYWGTGAKYPQRYNDIPIMWMGKFYISNSTHYHYYGEFSWAWEGACTLNDPNP